jgi:hypothetical protein
VKAIQSLLAVTFVGFGYAEVTGVEEVNVFRVAIILILIITASLFSHFRYAILTNVNTDAVLFAAIFIQ